MDLLPGVSSHVTETDRLRLHHLESGPPDGIPVVLVHGNLSTGRFYEHLLPGAPGRYRFLAPDMRGFGDTERLPLAELLLLGADPPRAARPRGPAGRRDPPVDHRRGRLPG